ncbi:MAG: Sec-independent protein translocase protein TatB [Pseudomonadota bacterium]
MSLLPQFGFIELLMVAVVALIVVGPKDLPILLRKCGQMLGQAKRMAGEFTSAFDQMARETEMDELRAEMEALKNANPLAQVKDEVDVAFKPLGDAVNETVKDGETLYQDEPDVGTDLDMDIPEGEKEAQAMADALSDMGGDDASLDEVSLSGHVPSQPVPPVDSASPPDGDGAAGPGSKAASKASPEAATPKSDASAQ